MMKDRDLSAFLKSELNRRMVDNRSYSLRAFAKALNLDASNLSKILNGQRKIGEKAQINLFSKLGINEAEVSDLFLQISEKDFDQMPEWYDTAILEQIDVTGFKATQKSLSQVFNLNETQVASALARLKKLNLVKISNRGIVTDATSGQTTNIQPQSTSLLKRNLQKQFLTKAIQSVDLDPLEERDRTTITCATISAKIAEAKKRIREFRRDLAAFLTSGRKSDRIYNISISLYPLSKNFKELK